ncbi:MAG: A/G-specific adenine glycosylase [Oscillibacter sp.]|nr:A/G-specific adenine glycosylase [Oscillibacter sp.]
MDLTEALLQWYRANARDLPWRHTREPYPIWVSEIMLQQTRVAAVVGYYTRFLEAFPTVEALAEASEEALLSLWQGLGYYSRARNLQKAAKEIVKRGGFPDTYEGLLSLPGIGSYTAGAIASAAFGLPTPAVDGNVLRIMSRLMDNHGDILSPQVRRGIEAQVKEMFPEAEEDRRIFNQALMELGATVCVPNGPPRCESCPVASYCLGRERGTALELPIRAAKKERRIEDRTVFVILNENRVALRKRPGRGLLAGLWEFPNTAGTLTETEAAETLKAWGLTVADWRGKLNAKHIFTHVEWRMSGYLVSVTGADAGKFVWADAVELREYAIPSAFGRYREAASDWIAEASRTPDTNGITDANQTTEENA